MSVNRLVISKSKCNKRSYVYFIQAGYTGPIKIGVSHNVKRRLDALQTSNHMKLYLLTSIGPLNRHQAETLEKQLHSKFKHQHVRGEWFNRNISLSTVNELDIPDYNPFPVGMVIDE